MFLIDARTLNDSTYAHLVVPAVFVPVTPLNR